jgi:hypothetical protein
MTCKKTSSVSALDIMTWLTPGGSLLMCCAISSRKDLLTADEFLMLVDRARNGTPAGRGWGVYNHVVCPNCCIPSMVIAAMGTRGYFCPRCGDKDHKRVWLDQLPLQAGDTSTLLPVGWERARLSMN